MEVSKSMPVEKVAQELGILIQEVEYRLGRPFSEFEAEVKAQIASGWKDPLGEIAEEAGWKCENCATKGEAWCDEIQGALYGGCPTFKPKLIDPFI